MSITATKKKTQRQRLLAYLRKNRRKGITSLEAAKELDMVCLHKRIAELEAETRTYYMGLGSWKVAPVHKITRTDELSATGSTVTRYKLAR